MLKPFFSEDASGNKAAFLNSVPNWREREKTLKVVESGLLLMVLAMVARFRHGKPNRQCLCVLHVGTDTVKLWKCWA